MAFGVLNSVTGNTAFLAAAGNNFSAAVDIMFYINLALIFCALIETTAFAVLCKKTSCAVVAGLVSVLLFVFGLIVFIVQLVLYSYGHRGTVYAVYMCLAFLACGFIAGGVYCCILSRNSHAALCYFTCAFQLVPPVGAALAVLLSYRIGKDTRVQEMVFNGYAYTYAALGSFCQKNSAVFADNSGEEYFEPLSVKQIKRKLKSLKARSTLSAENMYEYASALINYRPYKYKKALRAMERAAEKNYSPALFNLGYYYERGLYEKKDYKKARDYYVKAVASGDDDAALRLGIIALEKGEAQDGMRVLDERAAKGVLCAKFDIGICYERGLGVAADMDRALDIYTECAQEGLFAAQKRIFALASTDINSAQNGEFFRKVTDRKFDGGFADMIDGLICIKKRLAADASEKFLSAILKRDKWEGVARCLVGTLYIDCGKLPQDKKNGAEYIKSAFDMLPSAHEIYSVVPRSILKIRGGKSDKPQAD